MSKYGVLRPVQGTAKCSVVQPMLMPLYALPCRRCGVTGRSSHHPGMTTPMSPDRRLCSASVRFIRWFTDDQTRSAASPGKSMHPCSSNTLLYWGEPCLRHVNCASHSDPCEPWATHLLDLTLVTFLLIQLVIPSVSPLVLRRRHTLSLPSPSPRPAPTHLLV